MQHQDLQHFPDDLVYEIVRYLPGTRLDVLRRISKQWNKIILSHDELWKNNCQKHFPNCNIGLYSTNSREAYLDSYLRHNRDPKYIECLIGNSMTFHPLKKLSIDPNSEDGKTLIVSSTNLEDKRIQLQHPSISPNGFFVAFTSNKPNTNTCVILIRLIQRRNNSNITTSIFQINTPWTFAFYSYWSSDSRILTWLGHHVGKGTFGMWAMDIHALILKNVKPVNQNYMLALEELVSPIEVESDDVKFLGRPLLYNLCDYPSKLFIHHEESILGYLSEDKFTEISSKVCGTGPPLVLKNGNMICTLLKHQDDEFFFVVLMDQKGKIIHEFDRIEYESNPGGCTILSQDQKYFAFGIRDNFVSVYDIEKKKRIDVMERCPEVIHYDIMFFSEYQGSPCLVLHVENNRVLMYRMLIYLLQTDLNWSIESKSLSDGYDPYISWMDQYALSTQLCAGEYFVYGCEDVNVFSKPELCISSTAPNSKRMVICEGDYIWIIPNNK